MCKSDPDRIRTYDPQLRRLLLYPLSYEAGKRLQRYKNILYLIPYYTALNKSVKTHLEVGKSDFFIVLKVSCLINISQIILFNLITFSMKCNKLLHDSDSTRSFTLLTSNLTHSSHSYNSLYFENNK